MRTLIHRYRCYEVICFLTVVCLTGCTRSNTPPLGDVKGRITFEGEPVEMAMVTFTPTAGGRQSFGRTDEDGNYVMQFNHTESGALVGSHRVVIISEVEGSTPEEGDVSTPMVKARKEFLPSKYNKSSELTADIKSGKNTVDFALTK
jgi:hypothetical protein